MDTAPRQCRPLAVHIAESVRLIRRHIRRKASDTGFHFGECRFSAINHAFLTPLLLLPLDGQIIVLTLLPKIGFKCQGPKDLVVVRSHNYGPDMDCYRRRSRLQMLAQASYLDLG